MSARQRAVLLVLPALVPVAATTLVRSALEQPPTRYLGRAARVLRHAF